MPLVSEAPSLGVDATGVTSPSPLADRDSFFADGGRRFAKLLPDCHMRSAQTNACYQVIKDFQFSSHTRRDSDLEVNTSLHAF